MDNRDRNDDTAENETTLDSPLGLAGEAIRKDVNDIRASNDEESIRHRRARAGLGRNADEGASSGINDLLSDEHDGYSSTDMGYGGDGTNVKP